MDSQTYMPTFQKARKYFESGKSKIYSFRLDGYPQVDWIIKDQTRYEGLGHCADLPYTFGIPYFWKYSWIFEGFDPEPWEYELNEAIKKEWTSLFKTGKHSLYLKMANLMLFWKIEKDLKSQKYFNFGIQN